jgi:uncharacterized membrane protein YtjA (UPF0391 family)
MGRGPLARSPPRWDDGGFAARRAVKPPEHSMIKWAIIFAVIAIVAGLFGFTGIAAGAAGIAKFLFVAAVVIFLIFLALALFAGKKLSE